MRQKVDIIKMSGDDSSLFPLIGPLVMNANVLKANNNYPYKTSERHLWHIALDTEGNVLGFMPMEIRRTRCLVDNYYVADNDKQVMSRLLHAISKHYDIDAMVQVQHAEDFAAVGFEAELPRVKYVKMHRTKEKKDRRKEKVEKEE
jgi:hypothetical protein